MKILFFSYAYPNARQPGLGTFNRSMIAGLVGAHEVRVVAPVPFPDVWRIRLAELAGVSPKGTRGSKHSTYTAVPGVEASHPTFYYPPKVLRSQYGQFLDWSVGRELNRVLHEFQPDVVLSYWAHPDGDVAVRAAQRHNVPSVVMVGGSDVLLLARSGARRKAILNVLNRADAVVTVSDHISDTLMKDGLPRKKLHVVRRGVDPAAFSPGDCSIARRGLGLSEERTQLVAVGRLVPVKGFQHLIASCAVLKTRGRAFDCHIVGDGPLRGQLQRQIELLGLEDCVKLEGPQSQMRLAEWYRAADLTVLSSLSEGVPNVLLESLACGTPFVATCVGGVPEIADRLYDRLVPPASPVAMADAIEGQLNSPREEQQRRCFEPFDLRASARKLERVLEGAIFDHAAAHHGEQVQSTSASPVREASPSASKPTNKFDLDWRNAAPSLNTPMPPSVAAMAISLNGPNAELTATTMAAFCRPSNGQFEGELGRTGEYFTLSAK